MLKNKNLTTKFLGWLCLGLIVAIGIAQLIFYFISSTQLKSKLGDLSEKSMSILQESEFSNAENIFLTIEDMVRGSIVRGEMEKFMQQLETVKKMKGVNSYILYDRLGNKSYEAGTGEKPQAIPANILSDIDASKPYVYQDENRLRIYRMIPNVADCLRCHHDWPEGGSGGYHYVDYSIEKMWDNKTLLKSKISEIQSGNIEAIIINYVIMIPSISLLAWFLLREFVNKPLTRSIRVMATETTQTSANSEHLATASQRIAASASEQAASIEETNSSLQMISDMTNQNAMHAKDLQQISTESLRSANEGAENLDQMKVAMNDVNNSNKQISKIMKTINEIAFQTNILALNASVEAARAGEHGKGFSVVAEEVRQLAMKCADAATETENLITNAIGKSKNAEEVSGKAVESIEHIRGKITQVNQLVEEISNSSVEQSGSISEVNEALTNLNSTTQEAAASSEEMASIASEMQGQAQLLTDTFQDLHKLVFGREFTNDGSLGTKDLSHLTTSKLSEDHLKLKLKDRE